MKDKSFARLRCQPLCPTLQRQNDAKLPVLLQQHRSLWPCQVQFSAANRAVFGNSICWLTGQYYLHQGRRNNRKIAQHSLTIIHRQRCATRLEMIAEGCQVTSDPAILPAEKMFHHWPHFGDLKTEAVLQVAHHWCSLEFEQHFLHQKTKSNLSEVRLP